MRPASTARLARLIGQLRAENVALGAENAALELEVRRLSELARTDALTGLPNRRALDEELARQVARSRREDTPLCAAVLDLDNFKAVNDAHGHARGDQVLREAARAWRAALRAAEFLARCSGDEFMVVLPNCSLRAASLAMRRVHAATPAGLACSAGVARWDGRESAAELTERADRALYAAKRAAGSRAVVADPFGIGGPAGAGA